VRGQGYAGPVNRRALTRRRSFRVAVGTFTLLSVVYLLDRLFDGPGWFSATLLVGMFASVIGLRLTNNASHPNHERGILSDFVDDMRGRQRRN
jgi:hypothetical protein